MTCDDQVSRMKGLLKPAPGRVPAPDDLCTVEESRPSEMCEMTAEIRLRRGYGVLRDG
jgi:hypothetical protein